MLEIQAQIHSTIRADNDNPFLQGPYRPIQTEYTASTPDLVVHGEIPRDLHGIYIRNSHNQVHEPLGRYHPFDGDGMLHAMHFADGHAQYRNRFIRTTGFLAEQAAGRSLWPGLIEPRLRTRRGWGSIGAMKDNAGTDVIAHAGKLLATMSQCSEPYRLDPRTLQTIGVEPEWATQVEPWGVCSHFKVDNATGEMMFFNFGEQPPYMHYGVIDRDNRLVHYEPIELPGARWPHDMGITPRYTILHDLPMFFDPALLAKGQHRLRFYRDMPSRFAVLPRHGSNADVRWFEATPCYILHLSNCFEDGDEVVMDGCISLDPIANVSHLPKEGYARMTAMLDKHNTRTRMYRWRFNLKTGQTQESFLDDEVTEFPMIANAYVGRPYRYSFNTLFTPGQWLFSGIKKYDLHSGNTERFEYGPGRHGSETQIALRPNARSDDDGYLLTYVSDMQRDVSECLIFDAAAIAAGPVARIELPQRISVGTHACWVEGDRIDGEAPQNYR
ncbi:MAG: carotenoid oxygenase family protein [Burkholderiales bacterium]|nr:carotenoid oxygenase family protein [Burkholderiales bacterium]